MNFIKASEAYEEYIELLEAKGPRFLRLFPNPAKDYIIIYYTLEIDRHGFIVINDLLGNMITKFAIHDRENQRVINTRNWKQGLYVVSLISNEKLIESVKFTLVD